MKEMFKRQITVVLEVKSHYDHAITNDFIKDDIERIQDYSINYYDVISIKDYEGESENE